MTSDWSERPAVFAGLWGGHLAGVNDLLAIEEVLSERVLSVSRRCEAISATISSTPDPSKVLLFPDFIGPWQTLAPWRLEISKADHCLLFVRMIIDVF